MEFLTGDVADPYAVESALQGIDTVCHQSAKVGLGVSFADAPDYVRNNDFATAVLLAAMDARPLPGLVLASSMVVYGEGAYTDPDTGPPVRPGPRPSRPARRHFDPRNPESGAALVPAMVTEEAPIDPRNVYAASKLSQEHLASAWARSTGGSAIALRYHNVYGPGCPGYALRRCRFPVPFGAGPRRSAAGLRRRRPAPQLHPCPGRRGGEHRRIDSLSSGGSAGFRAYNVGADEVRTIGDVAAALSRLAPDRHRSYRRLPARRRPPHHRILRTY